jgi:hypothetical protein
VSAHSYTDTGTYHTLKNGVRHLLTPAELYAYNGQVWPGFTPPVYDENGNIKHKAKWHGHPVEVPADLEAHLNAEYGL